MESSGQFVALFLGRVEGRFLTNRNWVGSRTRHAGRSFLLPMFLRIVFDGFEEKILYNQNNFYFKTQSAVELNALPRDPIARTQENTGQLLLDVEIQKLQ